jgi:hypothetical protein
MFGKTSHGAYAACHVFYRYGDRYPKSFGGKAFAIYWMLMGLIVFGLLTSFLQTAITTITVTVDSTFNGKQVCDYWASIQAQKPPSPPPWCISCR